MSNNAEWASLGGGVYTPLCQPWTTGELDHGPLIRLNLTTHKRSKIPSPDDIPKCRSR